MWHDLTSQVALAMLAELAPLMCGTCAAALVVIATLAAVGAVGWLGPRSGWPLSAVAVFHAAVCLRLFRRPLTPMLCALVDLGFGVILCAGVLLAS